MSYAGASKGGTAAILAAEDLRAQRRSDAGIDSLPTEAIRTLFGAAVDRLMGEAGLWDEPTACTALIQAGGDLPEAVHLLRAHRSTLARFGWSIPVDTEDIVLLRRIVPATREPLGPQLLGDTVDYSARLLRRPGDGDPLPRTNEMRQVLESRPDTDEVAQRYGDETVPRYSSWLRAKDMLVDRIAHDDPEPTDLALGSVHLPAPRSALLTAISLGETGGLIHMWYRSILGPDGYANEHVTLGDVRHGRVRVQVTHPVTGNPTGIGQIRVSDCECVAHLDDRGEDPSRFEVGYAMALGHNERKVIAGSVLDLSALRHDGTVEGDNLQQLILLTTDGLASNGFLEHLKLPHYVTFTSQMDRASAARAVQEADAAPAAEPTRKAAAARPTQVMEPAEGLLVTDGGYKR